MHLRSMIVRMELGEGVGCGTEDPSPTRDVVI